LDTLDALVLLFIVHVHFLVSSRNVLSSHSFSITIYPTRYLKNNPLVQNDEDESFLILLIIIIIIIIITFIKYYKVPISLLFLFLLKF